MSVPPPAHGESGAGDEPGPTLLGRLSGLVRAHSRGALAVLVLLAVVLIATAATLRWGGPGTAVLDAVAGKRPAAGPPPPKPGGEADAEATAARLIAEINKAAAAD